MNPISRRQLLKALGWGAGAAAVAPTTLASLLAQAAPAGAAPPGRVLVLVQLGGGNDGLDTVVPIGGPDAGAYASARGPLARTPDRLLPLDGSFALAGELPRLKQWWDAGHLAVVHGVHHDHHDLSHFGCLAIVWAGSTDAAEQTGWVGRTLDRLGGGAAGGPDPLLAVSLDGPTPILVGRTAIGASVSPDPSRVFGSPTDTDADPAVLAAYRAMSTPVVGEPALDAAARSAQATALHVGEALGPHLPAPPAASAVDALGTQLAAVAALVTAGLPTRVYHVTHDGDFDVHANEAGRQPALLATLDGAIGGFFDLLGAAGAGVVLATYSEFGRRVAFNGSGTDHGAAAPWFVVGPAVKGGHHGQPPSLTALDDHGNLVPTTDFRSVGATLVGPWLGVDPAAVFGPGVPTLGFV
ncbi:MAG: DUF1501 domain-containing protein [Acidimicrobiales bacterium]|nr:DUF1501 domain-containing protein [Acidimicrobiales bacterium]